jgi:non-specific serine/threonine protein kinase
MAAEYDNVRLALDWAGEDDPDLQVVMISKLDWFWTIRGTVREARQRILSALARNHSAAAGQARLHMVAASWFYVAGELETAMAQVEEAVLLLDRFDDPELAGKIINMRGILRAVTGDLAGAERDFSHLLQMSNGQPPSEALFRSLNNLAMVHLVMGRAHEALARIEQAIEVLAQLSHRPLIFTQYRHTQGAVLLALGRIPEARAGFLDGLEEAAEYGNYQAAVALLQGLACCAAESSEAVLCLELLASARSCARTAGLKVFEVPGTPTAAAERRSRTALGEQAAEHAWARGFGMDLPAALERARAKPAVDPGSVVTPRKLAIIRLVAAGLANKEIAQRLSISERTVEAHLEQVRNQLGFHNRAQVAAWAVSSGLLSNPTPGALQ